MMHKLLIIICTLIVLSSCGTDYLDERHEHDDVTCVYRVERDFWGTEQSEEVVACD